MTDKPQTGITFDEPLRMSPQPAGQSFLLASSSESPLPALPPFTGGARVNSDGLIQVTDWPKER